MKIDQIKESNGHPTGGNAVAASGTTTFNIKEFLLKYLYYSWLFILIMVLSFLIAWLYLRYTKPVYSVDSSLLIRTDKNNRGGGSGSGADMFADIALFQDNVNKQNEILILSSRTMMERVVKALGLQKSYFVEGNVKTTNIYKEQPFDVEILSLKDSLASFALRIKLNESRTFTINESHKANLFRRDLSDRKWLLQVDAEGIRLQQFRIQEFSLSL